MTNVPEGNPAAEGRRQALISAWIRAIVFAVAWLPFTAMVLFFVPRFERLFADFGQAGALPAITGWLCWWARLNGTLLGLPSLAALGVLLLVDAGIAGLWYRSRCRPAVYWLWFAAVVGAGILAVMLVPIALLLPLLTLQEAIR